MTDTSKNVTNIDSLHQAEAAAREALDAADNAEGGYPYEQAANRCHHALDDLLAALDAARGEAVAWAYKKHLGYVEEDGSWETELFITQVDDSYVPLYAAPPAALAVDGMAEITRAWNAGYKAARIELGVALVAERQAQQPAAAVPEGVTLPHDFAQQIAKELRYLIDEVYGKDRRAYDREIELVRRLDAMLAAAERAKGAGNDQ